MKIAIIGTGNVGQTFAVKLNSLGHEVMMGTRNVANKLAVIPKEGGKASFNDWHSANKNVKLGNYAEAAAFGEIILNVTNGAGSIEALKAAGANNLKNKILVDISNPLDFSKGMPPCLLPELSNTNSLGEEIQRIFPETKVVKTLNTMWCGLMVNPNMINGGDHTAFMCGEDAEAKKKIRSLMHEFGWKDSNILDLGGINAARGTEAVLPVWLRIYGATKNGAFNFKLVS